MNWRKAWFLGVAVLTGCGIQGGGQDALDAAVDDATGEALSSSSNSASLGLGGDGACALYPGGRVLCWGDNTYGQLGNANSSPQITAVLVSGLSGLTATAVARGIHHSCALLSDSTVRCWGGNFSGQLGNGNTVSTSTPVAVSGISTATAVAGGGFHTCARLSNSTVKCWGYNASGQLGPLELMLRDVDPESQSAVSVRLVAKDQLVADRDAARMELSNFHVAIRRARPPTPRAPPPARSRSRTPWPAAENRDCKESRRAA